MTQNKKDGRGRPTIFEEPMNKSQRDKRYLEGLKAAGGVRGTFEIKGRDLGDKFRKKANQFNGSIKTTADYLIRRALEEDL